MIIQSPRKPGGIFDALRSAASPDLIEVRLAIAYVTQSGVRKFIDMMEEQVGPAWSMMPKHLVTCVDFGFTDPDALREWLKLGRSTAALHNVGIKNALLKPPQAFHAKYYEFRSAKSAAIAITSANFSKSAFTSNHEVMSLVNLTGDLGSADAAWRTLKKGATTATPAVIDDYEKRRKKIAIAVSNAVYTRRRPGQRLWDAIEAKDSNPSDYKFFWVDAGSMSSGGSANQLELPRGGHRYFGGAVKYDNQSKKIVDVNIRFAGSSYERPISWHGSNRMERLNLPTGSNYSSSVILFERRGKLYDLTIVPAESLESQSWADRSDAVDQLFKVGLNSPRRCGFF